MSQTTLFNTAHLMQIEIPIDHSVKLEITTIVSKMFSQNAFILRRTDRHDCLIVDPSFEYQRMSEYLLEHKYDVAAILNTHGHIDHIFGNEQMKRQFPTAPLIIGELDAYKLTDAEANLSASYGIEIKSPNADKTVKHGEIVSYAGISLETRLTPGHSLGHVVWICQATEVAVVVNGDVLFAGSVGRTDFPDGDFEALEQSIQKQLYTLPNDTIVLTGHGNITTIGQEKDTNPFVRPVGG